MTTTERYGHRIDVDELPGTGVFVVLVDDDEVGHRPSKIAAISLGEQRAKRLYRAANPVERTELEALDETPYRDALRGEGPVRA